MSAELLPLKINVKGMTPELAAEIRAYARANIAKVEAERDAARAEVERFRKALVCIRDSTFRSAVTLRGIADATITDNRERGE